MFSISQGSSLIFFWKVTKMKFIEKENENTKDSRLHSGSELPKTATQKNNNTHHKNRKKTT